MKLRILSNFLFRFHVKHKYNILINMNYPQKTKIMYCGESMFHVEHKNKTIYYKKNLNDIIYITT